MTDKTELASARADCDHWRKDYTELQGVNAGLRAQIAALTAQNESARAEERERCAKIADWRHSAWNIDGDDGHGSPERSDEAKAIADLIRAGSPAPAAPAAPVRVDGCAGARELAIPVRRVD